ncbi:MAG: hypothetical protein ACOCXD_01685 [Bacteroidota bacterium]
MKSQKNFLQGILLASIIIMASCSETRKIARQEVGTEIDMPCYGRKYQSDKRYFRANQISTSSDISYSKEKALLAAKRKLTSLINSQMKSVTSRYANERDVSDKHEFEQKMENETREVINQKLHDVAIICEKTHVVKGDLYRTFMGVEIPKEDFFNSLNQGISKDERLQLEYDQKKFREIYDEEMKKLENESGQ